MGSDLERTRRYEVSDFPPGTRMLMGNRRDLDEAIRERGMRPVGKFNVGANGVTTVPVVYVSKRAQPFYVRHRWPLIIGGGVLSLASGVAILIMTVGLPWFIAGVVLMAFTIATLARYSRGGGGRRVSVTTTTTTNVRVR